MSRKVSPTHYPTKSSPVQSSPVPGPVEAVEGDSQVQGRSSPVGPQINTFYIVRTCPGRSVPLPHEVQPSPVQSSPGTSGRQLKVTVKSKGGPVQSRSIHSSSSPVSVQVQSFGVWLKVGGRARVPCSVKFQEQYIPVRA